MKAKAHKINSLCCLKIFISFTKLFIGKFIFTIFNFMNNLNLLGDFQNVFGIVLVFIGNYRVFALNCYIPAKGGDDKA